MKHQPENGFIQHKNQYSHPGTDSNDEVIEFIPSAYSEEGNQTRQKGKDELKFNEEDEEPIYRRPIQQFLCILQFITCVMRPAGIILFHRNGFPCYGRINRRWGIVQGNIYENGKNQEESDQQETDAAGVNTESFLSLAFPDKPEIEDKQNDTGN
jgi:hypothetical protein